MSLTETVPGQGTSNSSMPAILLSKNRVPEVQEHKDRSPDLTGAGLQDSFLRQVWPKQTCGRGVTQMKDREGQILPSRGQRQSPSLNGLH